MPPRPSTAATTRSLAPALLAAAAFILPVRAATADDGSCSIPSAPEPSAAEVEAGKLDADTWAAEAAQELPAGRGLDPGAVGRIVAAIQAAKPPEKSWWDRFVEWLASWVERDRRQSKEPSWLIEWLRSIPDYVVKNVFLAMLAMMVIGLGVLVIYELRAAGVGRRRAAGAKGAAGAATPAAAARLPSLAEIAALPLAEQPAALLRWAIAQLVERELLPADASLTNGELLALLRARAPQELPAFRRLTRTADAALYGAVAPTEHDVRELIGALQPAARGG